MKTIRGLATGRVQGVGFRNFIKHQADLLGVSGYAKNLADERVEFVLQGDSDAIINLIQHINRGPLFSSVKSVSSDDLLTDEIYQNFSIR
ncbi:MAG: acylphosphatase [Gammaproteobacteria bacterium]|jgi:acylphosphatase